MPECPDCGGTGGYVPAYVVGGEIVGPDACPVCDGTGQLSDADLHSIAVHNTAAPPKNLWKFVEEWYSEAEIIASVKRDMIGGFDARPIPPDVHSEEFGKWLCHEYRLAMHKGMDIAIHGNWKARNSPKTTDKSRPMKCKACDGLGTPAGEAAGLICGACNGTGEERPERDLWHGTACEVPRMIAVCPECQGTLSARALQWDTATGRPEASAIELDCETDCRGGPVHRHFQSDWQPVRDTISKWCEASDA